MAFIQIGTNQGITQAIAQKLGIKGKEFSVDVWNQVVGLVEAESKQKNIFDESKGKDIDSKDYHSNYVVNEGTVELSDNTWNRICRILGKEKECVNIKSETPQDTSPSVTQANNLAKAFNLITRGLRDGKLKGTPPEFRSAIVKAYGNVDKSGGNTPTVAEYVFSLLVDAQKIMGKTDNLSQEMAQRAIGGIVELCPEEEFQGKKCSEYSDPKVVEQFMKDNNISATSKLREIKYSESEMIDKIDNSIKPKLNEILKGKTFKGPNNTVITGEQLLDVINKEGCFYCKASEYGAAQAHAESGQIEMNLNQIYYSESDAEIMKIIIHEALHCAYNTRTGNTREEERLCESQAIQITAELVENEKSKPNTKFTNFSMYGRNIEEFNDKNKLDSTIEMWINAGYSNRTENIGGDIVIIKNTDLIMPQKIMSGNKDYLQPENRIEIKQGDEIYIDNQKITTVGEAKFESALLTSNRGNSNICRLDIPGQRNIGTVVFDNTIDNTGAKNNLPKNIEPKTIKIMRNGIEVCTGKIYLSND